MKTSCPNCGLILLTGKADLAGENYVVTVTKEARIASLQIDPDGRFGVTVDCPFCHGRSSGCLPGAEERTAAIEEAKKAWAERFKES